MRDAVECKREFRKRPFMDIYLRIQGWEFIREKRKILKLTLLFGRVFGRDLVFLLSIHKIKEMFAVTTEPSG